MLSAPNGSTPKTRQAGRICLTAAGHPREQTAAADGNDHSFQFWALLEPFQSDRCRPAGRERPFVGVHEGPTLLPADPLGGGEGCRHVGHHDELGPIAARLLDPGGIGAGHHNHFGMRAELARRPGGRNGVVAGADRGDAAGQLIRRQAEHDGQCPACLKGPGMLEELELEVHLGASRQESADFRAVPVEHGRARDPTGQMLPGRSDLGQGRGHHLQTSPSPCYPG